MHLLAALHNIFCSAASWEFNRLWARRGCTELLVWFKHTSPSLRVTLHWKLPKQFKKFFKKKRSFKRNRWWTGADVFKSPSEAPSLCEFTKVYHGGGGADLRPLISSLRSQTRNDPHLSVTVQLVSDTTTGCEFRWGRRKRTATPRRTSCPPHGEFTPPGLTRVLRLEKG